jgi:hypothetical protein
MNLFVSFWLIFDDYVERMVEITDFNRLPEKLLNSAKYAASTVFIENEPEPVFGVHSIYHPPFLILNQKHYQYYIPK